jgi:hypothetical protein
VRLGPVFKLYARFDGTIVAAANNLAHACRITAAANIFHQKGMIEIAQFGIGKAKFSTQPHAEKATAQRMARNGAFRQIKRK